MLCRVGKRKQNSLVSGSLHRTEYRWIDHKTRRTPGSVRLHRITRRPLRALYGSHCGVLHWTKNGTKKVPGSASLRRLSCQLFVSLHELSGEALHFAERIAEGRTEARRHDVNRGAYGKTSLLVILALMRIWTSKYLMPLPSQYGPSPKPMSLSTKLPNPSPRRRLFRLPNPSPRHRLFKLPNPNPRHRLFKLPNPGPHHRPFKLLPRRSTTRVSHQNPRRDARAG